MQDGDAKAGCGAEVKQLFCGTEMIPFQVTEGLTAGGPFGVHKTS